MVTRRAVMTIRRGVWSRDYYGFVFAISETPKAHWCFVPDIEQNRGLGSFYQNNVQIRGPNFEPKFTPKNATLIDRCVAEKMIEKMQEALGGLL